MVRRNVVHLKCFQVGGLYFTLGITVAFPALFDNYFLYKHQLIFFMCRKTCTNDSAQNNPFFSDILHALLVFLAFYT
jgi:hypothetical protein